MSYDNTNSGILSRNDRKEKDTHPDFTGQINVDGVDYWLNGWTKERKDGSGRFFSLSVKPKDARQEQAHRRTPPPAATRNLANASRPAQRPAQDLANTPSPRSSGFDDMDDNIPF